MNREQLATANELASKFQKATERLAALSRPDLNIVIVPHKQTQPIMTIGTSPDCEHEAAPIATDFLAAIRTYYLEQADELQGQFDKL